MVKSMTTGEVERLINRVEQEFIEPARRNVPALCSSSDTEVHYQDLLRLRAEKLVRQYQKRNISLAYSNAKSTCASLVEVQDYARERFLELHYYYATLQASIQLGRPELVLSAFRTDIEGCLRQCAEKKCISGHKTLGFAGLADILLAKKSITSNQRVVLARLYDVLSMPVHHPGAIGAEIAALMLKYAPVTVVAVQLALLFPGVTQG